jgi:hypothetical protein
MGPSSPSAEDSQRIDTVRNSTNLSTIPPVKSIHPACPVLSCPRDEETNTERDYQPSPAPQPPQLEKRQKKQRGRNLAAQGMGAPRCSVASLFPPPGPVWLLGLPFPGPPRWMGKRGNCSLSCTVPTTSGTTIQYKSTKVQECLSHSNL